MTDDPTYALRLTVNGSERKGAVAASDTLLGFLRDQLGLTGAKRGCNQGLCGACTVMLDGEPVRACLSIAADCDGRDIETVEGLIVQRQLSAVQQSMAEAGAIQCGFCTSGMVIALTALLRKRPSPSVEEVREAISGQLCRCTGYVKIVEAAILAATRGRHEA